jgi:hypothetical protein
MRCGFVKISKPSLRATATSAIPDASAVRTASRPFDQHEGIAFHDHAVDKRPAIAAQFSRSDTADWNFSNFNNDQFNSRLLHGMSCAEVNALVHRSRGPI